MWIDQFRHRQNPVYRCASAHRIRLTSMPLLVRAAPERNTLLRVTTLFLWLTVQLAAYDELDGAFATFSVCAAAASMLAQPSRRHAALLARCAPVGDCSLVHCSLGSWQKGMNRVVIWSFDNMYSEHVC